MWLRLTGQKHGSALLNTDNVNTIDDHEFGAEIWFKSGRLLVKESIDEIEIMLAGNGAEVKRADPHARDFIGLVGSGQDFKDVDGF